MQTWWLVLTFGSTGTRIILEKDSAQACVDCFDFVNWGGKTYTLWAAPFSGWDPRLYKVEKENQVAVCISLLPGYGCHVTSCFTSFLTVMVSTLELWAKQSFSFKWILSDYFISTGMEAKIIGVTNCWLFLFFLSFACCFLGFFLRQSLKKFLSSPGCPGILHVDKTGLELTGVHLPLLSECWAGIKGHVPPLPAQIFFSMM